MRAADLRQLAEWLRGHGDDGWAEAVETAAEDLEYALEVGWQVHELAAALRALLYDETDTPEVDATVALARYDDFVAPKGTQT